MDRGHVRERHPAALDVELAADQVTRSVELLAQLRADSADRGAIAGEECVLLGARQVPNPVQGPVAEWITPAGTVTVEHAGDGGLGSDRVDQDVEVHRSPCSTSASRAS